MAVIRLRGDGGLWIRLPVAPTPAVRAAVDALGPVRHLIARNGLGHRFLAGWAAAYPTARIHDAPGLTEQTTDTAIRATLGPAPDPAWGDALDQVFFLGNDLTTETVFFHRASSTILVKDLVQHLQEDWYRGWRAVVARLPLRPAQGPSCDDRQGPGASRRRPHPRMADKLAIAHESPIRTGAQAMLRQAVGWRLR